jgi:REP-associated tyrosine transposase
MARPLRIAYPGACYHATARGNERRAIFRDDGDREQLLARLEAVVARYRLIVHAYVLMRNHYHLLLETPEGNLSEALRQLNAVYTQDFNRRHGRVGHLFQGRYKAILVDKDSYLVELSRYIHLNPVRVGEVTDPARFRWSSAAAYVGRRGEPPWLTVAEVLRRFGQRRGVAQSAYRQFLLDGIRQKAAAPWNAVVGQLLLGETRWVARMRRRASKRRMDSEVAYAGQLRARPALSLVITQVGRAAKVSRQDLVRPLGDRGGWARPLAMYLAWEFCGMTQREIGEAFGVGHFAVSKAIRRAQQRQQADKQVAKVTSRLITAFQA